MPNSTGEAYHSEAIMARRTHDTPVSSFQETGYGRTCPHAMTEKQAENKITNSKPIPHIPLPFKEVIADVLKVKPPERSKRKKTSKS